MSSGVSRLPLTVITASSDSKYHARYPHGDWPGDAATDWVTRSTAAGVIAAHGFDTDADVFNWYNVGANGTRVARDTSVKVSGSSMRFDLLAGETGANISGSWSPGTPTTVFGQSFSQNSTFYIQYRARISATMVSNLQQFGGGWNSNWKQLIIHRASLTCAAMEITHTYPQTTGSTLYTDCGARGMWTNITDPYYASSPPLLLQQGWDLNSGPSWAHEANSYHIAYPGPNQWNPPTDTWYTVYIKVDVGTLTNDYSVADSKVQMWVAPQNQFYWNKVVSTICALAYDGTSSDGFNNLTFTPYMTALSTSASADAHMWIDELIVSTQPIAIPMAVLP